MLLLKKKKYAALAIKEKGGEVTYVQETKVLPSSGHPELFLFSLPLSLRSRQGLDMVRRDWCVLSHDVGNFILKQILSRESREDLVEACHEYLRQVTLSHWTTLIDCRLLSTSILLGESQLRSLLSTRASPRTLR
jgi:DNA polymerase alpha subunit A